MKTIITALAIATLSASAIAAPLTAIGSYELTGINGTGITLQEANVGLRTTVAGFGVEGLVNGNYARGSYDSVFTTRTPSGTFTRTVNTAVRSSEYGFEVAGTKSFAPVYGITPMVRLGLGQKNLGSGQDFNYFVAEVQARKMIATGTTAVVGFRHRNGTNVDLIQNRVSVGVEYALNKRAQVGVSYVHSNFSGNTLANGALVTASYSF